MSSAARETPCNFCLETRDRKKVEEEENDSCEKKRRRVPLFFSSFSKDRKCADKCFAEEKRKELGSPIFRSSSSSVLFFCHECRGKQIGRNSGGIPFLLLLLLCVRTQGQSNFSVKKGAEGQILDIKRKFLFSKGGKISGRIQEEIFKGKKAGRGQKRRRKENWITASVAAI